MTEIRYREVEIIRDPDGVIAVITQRTDTGYLSFRFQKEYVTSQGTVKATSYLGARHCDAIERLTKQVRERIDVLTDQFKLSRARQGYSVP